MPDTGSSTITDISTTAIQYPSITYKGGKPIWDLAQTTAYPIELQRNGKLRTAQIYLTPYEPSELKDVLKRAMSGYRREKQDVEIVREDRNIYAPLCDAHFVKLGNATGTPDQQRGWLDKYPEMKPAIIEHTFGGLRTDLNKPDVDEDTLLDISAELSSQVETYQELYDPIKKTNVRVDMVHYHAHPTEIQYREYRSARRSKFIRKTTLWTTMEQHNALEKLYDAVIQSISGGCVNGIPCDNAKKSEWIGGVPLWHKLFVVDQIFSEIVEKNV